MLCKVAFLSVLQEILPTSYSQDDSISKAFCLHAQLHRTLKVPQQKGLADESICIYRHEKQSKPTRRHHPGALVMLISKEQAVKKKLAYGKSVEKIWKLKIGFAPPKKPTDLTVHLPSHKRLFYTFNGSLV